jgi:CheY-like chemotaxis protein
VEVPEMDGLEATREIRSRLPIDRQPTIFGLTAHAGTEYREICVGAGMDGYLTKPLELAKLQDLIAYRPGPVDWNGAGRAQAPLLS